MVDPVVASKICIFLCFNVLYLVSAAWFMLHAFVFHLIKSEASFELSTTFTSLIFLNGLIAFFVLLLSIFGLAAFCIDKPKLFQTYAILLLVGIALQITNEFLVNKANNEVIVKSIKQNLPKFEFILSSLQFEIQATQQKHDCCGFDSFTNYYEPSEPNPRSKIPNSCCGKYNAVSSQQTGACSFEEYSQRADCGRRLLSVYKDFLGRSHPFVPVENIRLILVILCQIFQAAAVGLSVFVYTRTKAEERRAGVRVIYSPIAKAG